MTNATNKATNVKANKTNAAKPVSSKDALALVAAAPASSNKETITAATTVEHKDVGTIDQVLNTNGPEVVQQAQAAAPQAEVIQSAAPATVSKASVANSIFKEMFSREQVPARKDMIKAAMQQAGLTEKGAATYLQNYKSKNGLVKKTTAAA